MSNSDLASYIFNLDFVIEICIKVAEDLISKVYPLTTILIPIVFTIFSFIFKERKDISYNTTHQKISFITRSLISVIILNFIIYFMFYFKGIIRDIDIIVDNFLEAIVILITFLAMIVLLVISYFNMRRSINIFKLCDTHFKKNKKHIDKIKQNLEKTNKSNIIQNSRKVNRYLNKFNNSSQIIGQIIVAQIEYNLATNFSKTLKKYLEQQEELFNLVNFEYAQEILLLQKFREKSSIYIDALDINYMLLERVTKNNKREEMDRLLHQFIKLIPGLFDPISDLYKQHKVYVESMKNIDQKIQNYYYKNLLFSYEVVSKRHFFEMNDIFLELLNKSNESQVSFRTGNIFSLYYVLIIQSIYNNNLKMLTNFINLAFILVGNQKENIILDSQKESPFTYDKSLCKVLIIAMLKSIELGHDKCTGFLIKVAVNHQSDLRLNNAILTFKTYLDNQKEPLFPESGISLESKDINENLLQEMDFKITLSSRSFDYCYFKMVNLIKKQQEYVTKLGLLDIKNEDIFDLDLYKVKMGSLFNKQYMDEKLLDMHREYGMIALKKT